MKLFFENHTINFHCDGKGPVVVLLHGFSESMKIWDAFAKELSTNYMVITIDLPGHGDSDCIGTIHTMERIAEVINSVLDKLKIYQCVMIGHSMGGYAELAFAERYPDKLLGICLFHSSAYADSPEAKINRERTIEILRNDHYDFFLNFIPDLFAPENKDLFSSQIEELIEDSKKISKQAIIASLEGMKVREDKTHILREMKVPFLFIAGKQDIRIPYQKILEQAGMPKDSLVLMMDGVGHMGHIEAKAKTLHAIKCFLDGIYS
jgi:pimeloyl-ACP methyl ester carboxylesterase